MDIFKQIETELNSFIRGKVETSPGTFFSQYELVKQIYYFANNIYQNGHLDSQGNYKYWFDIISPAIDTEVKNIDFDVKDVFLDSDFLHDSFRIFLANHFLREYFKDTGQTIRFNEFIEESTGLGNIVWKKIKGDYKLFDPMNFFVINQCARNLNESPVIERHMLTQSEMRAKYGVWDTDKVKEAIKHCGNYELVKPVNSYSMEHKETPYYEIFERNGEISVWTLKRAQGIEPQDGDREKYILAKIVTCGLGQSSGKGAHKYVLYADKITKMPYKEYHRGRYNGRWWRLGFYEMLMDIQIRCNEIGNQIARSLEFSGHQIYTTSDETVYQNILTDLKRGDIIKAPSGLKRVDTRSHDVQVYLAEWNHLIQTRDQITASYEIAQGQTMPAGTPFRLGALINSNANKLYTFIRQKLASSFRGVISDWILPDIMGQLRAKDILRITGDSKYLETFLKKVVEGWYNKNLLAIGPHTAEQGQVIRDSKLKQLMENPERSVGLFRDYWLEFRPRVQVIITGENVNIDAEMQTLAEFIQLEADPVRRQAMIEQAMARKGIDITHLPKTEEQVQAPVPPPANVTVNQGAPAPQPQPQPQPVEQPA